MRPKILMIFRNKKKLLAVLQTFTNERYWIYCESICQKHPVASERSGPTMNKQQSKYQRT